MKTASPAMVALLASRAPLIFADLYTFTFADASVLRYTTFDTDLTVGGHTFVRGGPLLKRGSISLATGLSVSTMDLTITPRAGNQVNGVPWLQAARLGAFDGCNVLVERTAMPTPGDTSAGKYWKFSGKFSDIGGDRLNMSATISSPAEIFNRPFPVNIFQPGCRRTLFDAGCTLNKASFASAATIGSGSTRTVINCSLAQANGFFTLGTIDFLDGDNVGAWRTIKSYTTGVITLSRPLISAPVLGNTATAYPGCDKTKPTCVTKYSNGDNFSGERSIPAPEMAV